MVVVHAHEFPGDFVEEAVGAGEDDVAGAEAGGELLAGDWFFEGE